MSNRGEHIEEDPINEKIAKII
jgi:hypothetical protein